MKIHNSARRQFLKKLAFGSLAASPVGQMLTMQKAFAASDYSHLNDYKALVCIYLYGGNDSFNMIIPTGASRYAAYAGLRGTLAVPSGAVLPLNNSNHGFAPQLTNLQQHYNAGRLALVSNVGNLIQPLTKQQYKDWERGVDASVQAPPQLFSHSDQTHFWQTGAPLNSATGGVDSGWGGRMADVLAVTNNNPFVPISYTVTGHTPWQSSETNTQLSINQWVGIEGFEGLEGDDWPPWAGNRLQVWQQMLAMSGNSGHVFKQQISEAIDRTRSRVTEVEAGLQRTWDEPNDTDIFATPYNPDNDLDAQLRMVGRMIYNHADFDQKRQIFVVGVGGWDTHSGQAIAHPQLLAAVDQAMHNFYALLVEMGMQQQVTAFTGSEFGRTLGINGDGTDHGWGTHHMVMGGAVNGADTYGTWPLLERNSNDDIGGAVLPTIATDQYGATLAKWMDVTAEDRADIFPHLHNFSATDLGFMG